MKLWKKGLSFMAVMILALSILTPAAFADYLPKQENLASNVAYIDAFAKGKFDAPTGQFAGRVIDKQGDPIAEASNRAGNITKTDQNGQFQVVDQSSNTQSSDKIKQYLLKNGSNIKIAHKYNDASDLWLVFDKSGANKLVSLHEWRAAQNNNVEVSADLSRQSTILQGEGSDWIGPFVVKADKNGNEMGWDFTGGNHNYDGETGSAATARTVDLKVWADGVEVKDGEVIPNSNVKIQVTNHIQGYNTKERDGSGREILKETVTYEIIGGQVHVHNEIEALEDVTIDRYYGLQSVNGIWNDKIRYYAGDRLVSGGSVKVNSDSGTKSVHPDVDKYVISSNEKMNDQHHMKVWLDRSYGLGRLNQLPDQQPIAFTLDYGKTYFTQIRDKEVKLAQGEKLSWRGGYHFYATHSTNPSHTVEVNNDEHKVILYNFEDGIEDGSGNGFDGTAHNVELTGSMFGTGAKLKGGSSYIETPLRSLGFGWTFSMWIKPDADNAGNAVLLESPEGKLIYNIDNSDKIGFTKENYKSVFDYKIPADKWTHIVLTGDNTSTSIFVNGSEFIATLEEGTELDTFILPIARIGSETNGFKGMIDEVDIRNTNLDLHGNLALHKHAESSEPESATLTADKAVDGDGDTRWSSAWVDDTWFLVDLGEPMEIDKVAISWESAYATKYRILVSEDKEKWTNVTTINNGVIEGKGGREIIKFPNTMARYVKFEGISRATIFGYSFEEFEVFSEKNQLGNKRMVIDLLTAIEDAKFDPAKYSKEVWQALQDAIAAATSGINQLSVSKPELAALLNPLNKSFDVIAVEDAFAALKLEGTEGAVANIRLPHKGLHDTRISWSTSDAAYINENGQLMKRPAAGQSDASLVLTATITKGEVTKTKEFKVTIKSLAGGSTWYPGPVVTPPVTKPGDQGNGGDSGTGAETGTSTETGSETEGSGNGGPAVTLKDIAGHWAEGAIKQAAELGIVTGNTAGLFQPDKPISRDEFVAMLVRALKLEGAGSELSFKDHKDIQAWARLAIAQAVQAGLVTGYSDQTFRPKALISRAEMAAIIVRGTGVAPAASAKLPFKDAAQIPQWAKSYVAAAYEAGIMSGRTKQTFAPEAQASRAEAVVVILRMLNKQ